MSLKIPALIGFTAISTTFLTTISVVANNDYKYKQKMEQYSNWRDEFFKNELGGKEYMCHNSKDKCLNGNKDKQYLPSPYEENLWEKLYESLKSNNKKQDKEDLKQLTYIQYPYQLKDYCYQEVKEAIRKNKDENNSSYFNATGHSSNSNHDLCVLSVQELKE